LLVLLSHLPLVPRCESVDDALALLMYPFVQVYSLSPKKNVILRILGQIIKEVK
jgi:hypothetical protein